MNSKKWLLILLILFVIMFTGCQKVLIQRKIGNANISVYVRKGYTFCEDAYSIVETENGYDVVVHLEKERSK